MKCFNMLIMILSAAAIFNSRERVKDCRFEGQNLYGRVKVVNSFPDFRVKVVNSFPDLKVMTVESFPDRCGRWKFVDSHEDFTVKFVDSHEDFSIKYVTAFPGMP